MEHFFLYLKGKDGEMVLLHMLVKMVIGILAIVIQIFRLKVKRRNGKDGTSPYIGPNGNWWINTSDTKIKAQGEKGSDGLTPFIKDGYWWIGTSNTGIAVQGPKGEQGDKGADGLTPVIKMGTGG